jgi:glycosyltransferase involved in cell wall biosynthesis
LVDHIFVHTDAMKNELIECFRVRDKLITVIPLGVNNSVPDTALTPQVAKRRLGIEDGDRTILFFGHIGPYKGLEFLIAAFQAIVATNSRYRLLIVGKPKTGCEKYLEEIQHAIDHGIGRTRVIQRIEFIPDEETELYFKAADVLALPYTQVFQSGVLILGYTFGLPVVAADVGSLREDIIEGRTGFLCRPCDPLDLAKTIDTYFESDLFRDLAARRLEIRKYAAARHSWDTVGEITCNTYKELLGQQPC